MFFPFYCREEGESALTSKSVVFTSTVIHHYCSAGAMVIIMVADLTVEGPAKGTYNLKCPLPPASTVFSYGEHYCNVSAM